MNKRDLNHLLIKVSATHRRRSSYEFMKHDLTAGQPRMLNYIYGHNGCIQREIAAACHLEPASVTSVLNSMEKSGLIEKKQVMGDKRALEVWLTEKGFEKKKTVDEIFMAMADECFKGFSEEEKLLAENFLTRIFNNMINGEQEAVKFDEKII
ncbi:MAG: transcriptional regulator [Eubacterium sp.]|nr:transcriptional regulator [Eubacterium sp.]